MHLVKEHIFEMAQEGAKLTDEERLHLKQCEECSNLFRMFVLHGFYTKRTQYGVNGRKSFMPVTANV